jgi:hypothetical protein
MKRATVRKARSEGNRRQLLPEKLPNPLAARNVGGSAGFFTPGSIWVADQGERSGPALIRMPEDAGQMLALLGPPFSGADPRGRD